jgi:hypothetical protein
MFQTRRIQVEAVQCMACGRYRVDGVWIHQDVHLTEVSHTFCPDCAPAVREELLREREFRSRGPEGKIEMLREDLVRQPLDEDGLLRRLDGLHVDAQERRLLLEGVRDLLSESLCSYCGQPLLAHQSKARKAGYLLHEGCARKLSDSVHEMRRMKAPEGKVDAYFDILQVPHKVRDGAKEMLAEAE